MKEQIRYIPEIAVASFIAVNLTNGEPAFNAWHALGFYLGVGVATKMIDSMIVNIYKNRDKISL